MGSGVELEGIDQMLANIRRKMEAGAVRMENEGLREAGELLAEAQRDKLNRGRDGRTSINSYRKVHMKDDIKISDIRRVDGIRFITIGPGKDTRWRAHFLEFGTVKMDAQPFLYPSLHENKGRVIEILAAHQRKGMQ